MRLIFSKAIQVVKEIYQHSKQSGFNQTALDQIAKQGFANAQFEVNGEDGLLVEEFYQAEEER